MTTGSGSRAGLAARPPPKTVRAGFPAYDSSIASAFEVDREVSRVRTIHSLRTRVVPLPGHVWASCSGRPGELAVRKLTHTRNSLIEPAVLYGRHGTDGLLHRLGRGLGAPGGNPAFGRASRRGRSGGARRGQPVLDVRGAWGTGRVRTVVRTLGFADAEKSDDHRIRSGPSSASRGLASLPNGRFLGPPADRSNRHRRRDH